MRVRWWLAALFWYWCASMGESAAVSPEQLNMFWSMR
jgi:hypothetical protein